MGAKETTVRVNRGKIEENCIVCVRENPTEKAYVRVTRKNGHIWFSLCEEFISLGRRKGNGGSERGSDESQNKKKMTKKIKRRKKKKRKKRRFQNVECATKKLKPRKLHWCVLGVISGYT